MDKLCVLVLFVGFLLPLVFADYSFATCSGSIFRRFTQFDWISLKLTHRTRAKAWTIQFTKHCGKDKESNSVA